MEESKVPHTLKQEQFRTLAVYRQLLLNMFSASMKRSIEGTRKKEDSLKVMLNEFINRHPEERNETDFTIVDGMVNVKHTLWIYDDDLVDGHFPFKFGISYGSFFCNKCEKLISLEGAPQKVGRDFWGGGCNFASLEGAPQEVGGNFYCNGVFLKKA